MKEKFEFKPEDFEPEFTPTVEIPKEEKLDLSMIVRDSKLKPTLGAAMLETFTPYSELLNRIELEVRTLNAENPTDADSDRAREIRLVLVKEIRKPAEKAKIDGKAEILIEGRLYDNIFKVIETSSKALELQCENIEKFQEKKLDAERWPQVEPYMMGAPRIALGKMSPTEWKNEFDMRKGLKEKRDKEAADAAQKLIDDEAEAKRIREENAKLKTEADELKAKNAVLETKVETVIEEKKVVETKLNTYAPSSFSSNRTGDKTKLLAFANALESIGNPELKSAEAQALRNDARTKLNAIIKSLRAGAGKL